MFPSNFDFLEWLVLVATASFPSPIGELWYYIKLHKKTARCGALKVVAREKEMESEFPRIIDPSTFEMKRDPGRGGEEFSFGFEKENVVEGEERSEGARIVRFFETCRGKISTERISINRVLHSYLYLGETNIINII